MKKTIINFNSIIENNIYNLDNVCYDNIKVLNMNKTQLKNIFKKYNFYTLLTTSKTQAKLAKNTKELNVYSIGLSIAPHTLQNNNISNVVYNVCSNSTSNCRKNCVIWQAGNPAYIPNKRKAMLNRKEFLIRNTSLFLACLIRLVELESFYSIKNKLVMTYRGNIASDLNYENVKTIYNNKKITLQNIINTFIQNTIINNFDNVPYDYTKNYNRKQNKNYHLAYSVNDNDINKSLTALKNGLDLAIIFNVSKNEKLPKFYRIGNRVLTVLDRDKHDYIAEKRNIIKNSVIHGLRFKYNAKHKKQKRIEVLNNAIKVGFVKNI